MIFSELVVEGGDITASMTTEVDPCGRGLLDLHLLNHRCDSSPEETGGGGCSRRLLTSELISLEFVSTLRTHYWGRSYVSCGQCCCRGRGVQCVCLKEWRVGGVYRGRGGVLFLLWGGVGGLLWGGERGEGLKML